MWVEADIVRITELPFAHRQGLSMGATPSLSFEEMLWAQAAMPRRRLHDDSGGATASSGGATALNAVAAAADGDEDDVDDVGLS